MEINAAADARRFCTLRPSLPVESPLQVFLTGPANCPPSTPPTPVFWEDVNMCNLHMGQLAAEPLSIFAGKTTVWTDRLRARSPAGRAAVPPRAVLRREGLSRFHKCSVRRRGSRLGSKMSSWVQLLLVLLAACLRFGVAEVS
ncbi:hybrid signal transduction histidine kinase B isoform X1 [Lates japonicus]|uniref:Hybrid signal transduction histidine kinase B isoform X1 n=1 Tax=Lates japonicus TaxID=270547 RepID=A0AAD3RM61_LATJO|nr:hybrid signal transduction histidine kinase B isoform X1 [Lates japonicus]